MKKLLSFFCLMLLCLSTFCLVACNGKNYTVEDVDRVYSQILTKMESTNGVLTLNLDTNKVCQSTSIEQDKAYIFPLIYDKYIKASSGLAFEVAKRQDLTLKYALNKFNQQEINDVYNKLNVVFSNVNNVMSSRDIFEQTSGMLYYKEFSNNCKSLINSLYDLNQSFNQYYFKYFYTDFQKETTLAEGNLKDNLSFYLEKLSRVSFYYELNNFELTNPYGEIVTWYNGTILLKSFNEFSQTVISKLQQTNLTGNMFEQDKQNILDILKLLQKNKDGYDEEYGLYLKSLEDISITEYFSARNKNAYVDTLPNREQAYYKIINTFLNGRHSSFHSSMAIIVSYL